MERSLEIMKEIVFQFDGDLKAELFGVEIDAQSIVEDYKWLIEQAEKVEKYEKALREIERWDKMLYSSRELGNFAKKALGLPTIPLKE